LLRINNIIFGSSEICVRRKLKKMMGQVTETITEE